VIAAAVILDPKRPIHGLTDSKKLTPNQREQLADLIRQQSIAWSIGRAEASEIDRINILQASLLAMQRAYQSLSVKPQWVKVDGRQYPKIDCAGEAIIKGDLTEAEISAASIIAKVARDQEMYVLDALYPNYDFAQHKAYPTQLHLQRLQQFSISPVHRRSFAPVKKCLFHPDSQNDLLNFNNIR
jgi:ribonuclease HII